MSSKIRVYHDIVKGPNVDIYANGEKLLDNVSYNDKSDYLEIPAGKYYLQITTHDTRNPIIDLNIDVAAKTNYTIVAHGDVNNLSSLSLLVLVDSMIFPIHGKSKVRFVHSAATIPNVDIYLNEQKILNDRTYGSATEYLTVLSGTSNIEITVVGEDNIVLSGNLMLESGKIYTIYTTGILGNKVSPLRIEIFTDSDGICYYH